MNPSNPSCAVALPRERNNATDENCATMAATCVRATPLRALSIQELREQLRAQLSSNDGASCEDVPAVELRIELTDRLVRDVIFRDPEIGMERVYPAGTRCRQFTHPKNALMSGIPFDHEKNWAAMRNLQSGLTLIWLDGMLRGVSFKDVEPIPEFTQEKEPS